MTVMAEFLYDMLEEIKRAAKELRDAVRAAFCQQLKGVEYKKYLQGKLPKGFKPPIFHPPLSIEYSFFSFSINQIKNHHGSHST